MPDYNFKNNLKSTLQAKLWNDATSISCNHVVESEDADTRRNAWPAFPFTLTVVDTANDHIEIIKCTSLANNSSDAIVFHCDRAQESTTAQTFEIATTNVEHRLTAAALNAVAKHFADTINIKDFGAVGDGVTDDTAAIQAAVNYAQTFPRGNAVYIPSGNYMISAPITISPNNYAKSIVIYGNGGSSRITQTSNSACFVFKNTISANGGFTSLDSCGLSGLYIASTFTAVTEAAIELWQCTNFSFTNMMVTHYQRCLYVLGGAALRASNFKFTSYNNTADSNIPNTGMIHIKSLLRPDGNTQISWTHQISNFNISAERINGPHTYSCIYQESADANHYSNFYIGHSSFANVCLIDSGSSSLSNVATSFCNGYMDSGGVLTTPYANYHVYAPDVDITTTKATSAIRFNDIFFNNPRISAFFIQKSMTDFMISNCRFNSCPSALVFNGNPSNRSAYKASISDCTFNNCATTAGTSVISLSDISEFRITGHVLLNSVSVAGSYFINISAGTVDNLFFDNTILSNGALLTYGSEGSVKNLMGDFTESFVPTDASGAKLSFTNVSGRCTLQSGMVFFTMSLTFPETTDSSQVRIALPYRNTNEVCGGSITKTTSTANIWNIDTGVSYLVLRTTPNAPAMTNADMSNRSITISGNYLRNKN